MDNNLMIASAITKKDKGKSYDFYCKSVLSNKQILAHILKECVLEFKDIPLEEIPQCIERTSKSDDALHSMIQGKPTEDESIHGAQIRYDVLFEVSLPRRVGIDKKEVIEMFINLEAQNNENLTYPLISRALYYCSRLLAKQKNAPDGFQKSDYGKIKKVYSIWICMDHAHKKNDVINLYSTAETCMKKQWHAPKENFDLMSAIMIYPGTEYEYDDGNHSLLEMLNILFISEISAKDKISRLSKSYGIHMTQKIEKEVDEMCNLSQGIRDRGIAEGMAQGIAEGKAEGKAEGIAIGMADGITKGKAAGIVEGITKGKLNMTIHHVKKLMQVINKSAEEIMNMLDVNEDIRPIILKSIKATEE